MIQGFSFALPLSLTVPTTVSILIASCGIHFENSCNLINYLPRYIFWSCPVDPFINDTNFFNLHALMWLLWLLSQTWITIHVWIPKCERLAATEKLFVNPMYLSALIDQSMAMNRRRDDEVAVFRISNWDSFMINLFPILIFIIVCFNCKNEVQIYVAQVMSAAYALLMMAVFVGTAIQMTEDGLSSPSAIFFCALSGSFVVAALLHPQEISCLAPAPLYLLSIPCMYLLLIIYSLINLNVVTWGTREVQTKKTKKELEEEKKAAEELKKRSILSFLDMSPDGKSDEGSIVFSLANLFKCMFCTYQKPKEEAIHLIKIDDRLNQLNEKLSHIERMQEPRRRSSLGGRIP